MIDSMSDPEADALGEGYQERIAAASTSGDASAAADAAAADGNDGPDWPPVQSEAATAAEPGENIHYSYENLPPPPLLPLHLPFDSEELKALWLDVRVPPAAVPKVADAEGAGLPEPLEMVRSLQLCVRYAFLVHTRRLTAHIIALLCLVFAALTGSCCSEAA